MQPSQGHKASDHVKDSNTCNFISDPILDTLNAVQQDNIQLSGDQDGKHSSEIPAKDGGSSSNHLGSDSDVQDCKQNDDSGISPNLDSNIIPETDEPICSNETETPAELDLDLQKDDELNKNLPSIKKTGNPPKSRGWSGPGMGQYRHRSPSPFMNRYRRLGCYAYPRGYMPYRYLSDSSTEQYRHRDMYEDYDDYT